MKRSLLLLIAGFGSLVASAQQVGPGPSPARGWDAVRALSPGASLDIKLRKGGAKCTFRSADTDNLVCLGATNLTLQRTDILQIKIHHRGRSTLSGMAIGAGAFAIAGYASTAGNKCSGICVLGPGSVAALGGIAGGGIGAITGFLTDFTRSTVYKAP